MKRLLCLTLMLLGFYGEASAQVAFQPQVHGFSCLRPATRGLIPRLTGAIGPIEITSTCGGRHAHNSQHYRGNAFDFRPLAVAPSRAVAVLHRLPGVGGIGAYSNGLVHADVGGRQIAWFGGRHRHRSHYAYRHRARYAGHHHRRYG